MNQNSKQDFLLLSILVMMTIVCVHEFYLLERMKPPGRSYSYWGLDLSYPMRIAHAKARSIHHCDVNVLGKLAPNINTFLMVSQQEFFIPCKI